MSDFKKILVALSFADLSKAIFNSAAKLAEGLGADLIVLNVINSRDVEAVQTISAMGYNVDSNQYTLGIEEERKAFLEDIIRESSFPTSRVKIVFQVGNPIDEILKIAVKEKVDMIVMGPKGKTNLEHVFIGSVAEKVFRRSPFTVVSFRDEEYAKRLKKRIQA
ncbi:MAG: universal stress protein [Desulfobacterales bacterium]